jgi:branched-chain amino acid transport system ATP-binding protein
VWDNVRLAAQSRDAAGLALAQERYKFCRGQRPRHAGHGAGRPERPAGAIAGTISHGEQRQLEIAMTLATDPQVLLLDEPLAGMGVAEAERMVELLLRLKKDHAMLLVEHDMDAVFALADAPDRDGQRPGDRQRRARQRARRRQCAGRVSG